MLKLGSPHVHPPRSVLDAEGGFLWWYVEIIDAEQDAGVVVVWSWGLPFLPGYAASDRAGHAPEPRHKPSLNVVVYRRGQEDLYVLHELAPDDVEWDGAFGWRFGESTFNVVEEDGQRTLDIALRCPVAGLEAPLEGRIRVTGNTAYLNDETASHIMGDGDTDHRWCPLVGPAFGSASLSCGDGYAFHGCGRAYFDRNYSHTPLHRLGIERWLWGHVTLEDRERIFYVLWPEGGAPLDVAGFDVTQDGRIEVVDDLTAEVPADRRTLFGMPWWDAISLHRRGAPWLQLALAQRVDDGPFYLRFFTRCVVDGTSAPGSCEVIVPARIDLHRYRPLVNMRVSSERHAGSFWNPLFSGPRRGRLRRLLGR